MKNLVLQILLACCTTAVLADDAGFTSVPAGAFTIAVIPDTQAYRGRDTKSEPTSDEDVRNPIFQTITDWIAKNREQQNIVFVSHVGDIVDKNVPKQWAVARQCIDRMHRVIITTHMDLGPIEHPKTNQGYLNDPKGRMEWKKCHSKRGNTAAQMWDKCFKRHKNLFLVCSGDQSRSQAMHLSPQGDHRNVVHSCLSDYSSDGSLRLYRFVPQENRVDVITYNTDRDQLTRTTKLVPNERDHQFSFEYSMQ